jgi:hypothetical protein
VKPDYARIRALELDLGFREPDDDDPKDTYLQWHAAKDAAERYPEEENR